MGVRSRIATMLRRERVEADFPPIAHDPENSLFILEGAGDQPGYLGAMLYGAPVAGLDGTTLERLRGALSNDIPAGSFIQISLLSTPDIEAFVDRYRYGRDINSLPNLTPEQRAVLSEFIENRCNLFIGGKEDPLIAQSGVKCNSTIVIMSIKCPIGDAMPNDREIKETSSLVAKISDSMATFGLNLERADAGRYLRTLRRIFKMHDRDVSTQYSDDELLKDQVLDPGDRVELGKRSIVVNDTHIGVLSVKRLPKFAKLSLMDRFIGDPGGLGNQLSEPYMMTLTLHYPDQAKKSAQVRRKAQVINYQAYGPMLRWVPRIAYKKHGFDVMLHTMEEGAVVVEMNFTLCMFARDEDALVRLMSATRTYYGSFGLEMAEDKYICWPVFFNTLPLFPSVESIKLTERFKTMAVKHAINFAPILSEWRGTGTGAGMMLLSRRGQPVLIDLYDSQVSSNAIIFAETRGGKSFLTQQLITDYLSKGAKIWVIDVGRSYYKLCKAVGGTFMSFRPDSDICMNPFTNVVDIEEEMELLKSIVAKMASPTAELGGFLFGKIEEAIKATWIKLHNSMTITDVAEWLTSQRGDDSGSEEVRQLGAMLYSFTRNGSYGSWFDGDNNLNFNTNFVVLELEELNSRKALQQVVLLQLIAKIQHEMFILESSGGKFPRGVIIDEAWDLLDDDGVARFFEKGYRRFAKYHGFAITVTQGIEDLYNSRFGRAIASNAPYKFILQQREETIKLAKENGRIALGDYGYNMMKTVQIVKGKFSEVLVHTDNGWGICRLVVSREMQVLFSTSGTERSHVIADMERGVPPMEAVRNYIRKEERKEEWAVA